MSSRDGIQSASLLPVLLALFLYFFTAGCVQVDKGDNSGTAHRNWNVLFIAVDDLRPALGCYGESQVQSPHIDRLAQEGMVFQRAYCQVSVCNPSRSSLLTGLRPDSVKVFNNGVHFRNTVPDVVTLPQHFKNHGYHTQAVGKIYHSSFEPGYHGRSLDDPASWSQPSWFPGPRFYHTDAGIEVARRVYGRRPDCGHGKGGLCIHNRWQPLSEQSITDPSDDRLSAWTEHFVQGLITEAPELPDIQLLDGTVTERALETLRELRDQEKFLLAVGFNKPHTPYVAPRQYWDLYDRSRLRLPSNRQVPKGRPRWPSPAVTITAPTQESPEKD